MIGCEKRDRLHGGCDWVSRVLLSPAIGFGVTRFPHALMSAQYDLNKAIGHVSAPQTAAWTTRDLLLYAVGIGASEKPEDYNIVYGMLLRNLAAVLVLTFCSRT